MPTEKKTKAPKEKKPFNFQKFWCIWNLAEAVLLLLAGVLSIVFGVLYDKDGDASKVVISNVLPYVVGAFVAMDAALRIVLGVNFKGKETDESVMLVGGFELTAGILIMIFHDIFTRLIINAIAVLLIVIGLLMLLFSVITIIKKSQKLFIPILEILFAAILVAVGIVVLVLFYTQKDTNQIVLITSGAIFSLAGIAQVIITAIKLHRLSKEEKKIIEEPKDEDIQTSSPVEETKAEEPASPKQEPTIEAKKEIKEIEVMDEPKAIEHKQ